MKNRLVAIDTDVQGKRTGGCEVKERRQTLDRAGKNENDQAEEGRGRKERTCRIYRCSEYMLRAVSWRLKDRAVRDWCISQGIVKARHCKRSEYVAARL